MYTQQAYIAKEMQTVLGAGNTTEGKLGYVGGKKGKLHTNINTNNEKKKYIYIYLKTSREETKLYEVKNKQHTNNINKQ